MRMFTPALLAACSLALAAFGAQAQSGPTPVPLVSIDVPLTLIDADIGTDVADAPGHDAALGSGLAGDALDALRGGSDDRTVTTNISDVDGKVDGNTAINSITGANLVDGGAFGNSAGLSTVIQNSGNNVLIQNSTVVSVQFAPTP
jgi:hypothetical protein